MAGGKLSIYGGKLLRVGGKLDVCGTCCPPPCCGFSDGITLTLAGITYNAGCINQCRWLTLPSDLNGAYYLPLQNSTPHCDWSAPPFVPAIKGDLGVYGNGGCTGSPFAHYELTYLALEMVLYGGPTGSAYWSLSASIKYIMIGTPGVQMDDNLVLANGLNVSGDLRSPLYLNSEVCHINSLPGPAQAQSFTYCPAGIGASWEGNPLP
jgi:hypothetical protein